MSPRILGPPDPWWRQAKSCQFHVQACDMNPQIQVQVQHVQMFCLGIREGHCESSQTQTTKLQRLEGRWPDYHRLELLEASRQ